MAIFREENPNQNVVEYNETERQPDAYDIAPVRDPVLYDSVDNYRKTYWSIDEFNKGGAIKSLYERYTDVIGNQRGVMVTNNGYISHDEKVYDSNAVILGAAAVNKTAIDDNVRTEYKDESFTLVPVAIAETRNQSFRYLTMNPDNNCVEDAGPVCHTCFVGGSKAPTHLIVPLTERQAIEDAQYLLESFHNEVFDNRPIEGEYIDKGTVVEGPAHECHCSSDSCSGGGCCGKCGSACKCKAELPSAPFEDDKEEFPDERWIY